jgi:hypothetical protein
MAALYEGAP